VRTVNSTTTYYSNNFKRYIDLSVHDNIIRCVVSLKFFGRRHIYLNLLSWKVSNTFVLPGEGGLVKRLYTAPHHHEREKQSKSCSNYTSTNIEKILETIARLKINCTLYRSKVPNSQKKEAV